MAFFDEKNLVKWVVVLPVVGVIITAIVFLSVDIFSNKLKFEKYIQENKIALIKKHKTEALKRVDSFAQLLDNGKNLLKKDAKDNVKSLIAMAYNIAKETQEQSKELNKKEIIETIKEKLRPIRFWKGTGYFFIYDFKGNCLMLPVKTSLEGKNLYNLKDAKNKPIIQEAIDIAKEKGGGFYEWWWYKPNENVMKKKIGYIKALKSLGLYIGTARYEEDIIENVKENIKGNLDLTNKNIFLYNMHDDAIMGNHKKLKPSEISEILKGSTYASEGFFLNKMGSSNFDVSSSLNQSLYVRYMPKYGWIIGTNTYRKETLEQISLQRKKLEDTLNGIIMNRILFALGVIGFMLIVTFFFSNTLKKVIRDYQKSLIDKNEQTKQQKKLLKHNLEHDYLTSLPNRILLTDRLNQTIKHSSREGKKFAVMFVDIDKFKSINDTLGHDIGDLLLQEIAKRLKHSIRDSDTVARFGGDEFIILVDDVTNIHDIIKVIDKVQKSIAQEIVLDKTEHYITLSMGISVFPDDGKSVQSLLKNADIAMYQAKNDGENRYRFFMPQMNTDIQNQIELENALRMAVEKNEFVLYYQPLVQTTSSKIVGAEALIRWNHPTRGLLFPDEFIEIAEQSSVILEMGQWIIHEAMRQMKEWKDKGYGLEKMSINIAVKQIENENFVSCVKNKLQVTKCEASWVEMEIIERFAMRDIKKSIEILNEIRKMNIGIAIDDFGTGHSSLAYLKQLPITKLKIDKVFVDNVLNSYEDKAIAESILALGSGLRLKVLAEGIETQEQRDFFAYGNCQEMQGYLFSKPLCAEEVEKLLLNGYIKSY